jgi:hypothetical protein
MARAIVVTAGPLASATDNKIGTAQKAAAAQYLVLNGAAGVATANNICTSQTPGGAVALTLNGTLCTTNNPIGFGGTYGTVGSAIAYLPTPSRIYITGGSDESGKTFAVVGTLQSVGTFGPGVVVTETITGPNASIVSSANIYSTIISITSSAGTAGAITVGTHATATLDVARRVQVKSAGNDSGITFTIAGTNWYGNTQSEVLTGGNAVAVYSVLDYLTVTSVLTSAAVATTVQLGTNGVCSSPWARMDEFAGMGPTSIQVNVSGTVNYTVSQTLDDPNSTSNPVAVASMTWINHPDSGVVAATAAAQANYAYIPKFSRITLNSETGTTAYASMTIMQNYLR